MVELSLTVEPAFLEHVQVCMQDLHLTPISGAICSILCSFSQFMVTGRHGQSGQSVTLSVEEGLDRGAEPARLLLLKTEGGTVRA